MIMNQKNLRPVIDVAEILKLVGCEIFFKLRK